MNCLKYFSNTLTSINVNSCSFSNTAKLDAISYLTHLESLQFTSNGIAGLDLRIIQPLLSITTPLKIKTLAINIDSSGAEKLLQLLIQKIGSYIEILVLKVYEKESRKELFDTVINSCEKIKFLHLCNIDLMNISQISKMISNFNSSLKYLTLETVFKIYYNEKDYRESLKISSAILKELSNNLPSLYYLDLRFNINPNDLQIIFDICKQIELKKLLIDNWNNLDHLDATLN